MQVFLWKERLSLQLAIIVFFSYISLTKSVWTDSNLLQRFTKGRRKSSTTQIWSDSQNFSWGTHSLPFGASKFNKVVKTWGLPRSTGRCKSPTSSRLADWVNDDLSHKPKENSTGHVSSTMPILLLDANMPTAQREAFSINNRNRILQRLSSC